MVGAAMTRTFRNLLALGLGLLLGGAASLSYAGYALMQPPQGLGFDPNVGYTWRPSTSTPPANGTWSGHGSVMYNGKRITLPGQWAPAANAGGFVRNALRFNPWLYVGTVAMAIATDAGFEYINEQWQKEGTNPNTVAPTDNGLYRMLNGACSGPSGCSVQQIDSAYRYPLGGTSITWHFKSHNCTINNVSCKFTFDYLYNGNWQKEDTKSAQRVQWCPAGTYPHNGQCVSIQPEPLTEADWQTIPTRPLTDPELDEFSRLAPGGMPVSDPEWSPAVSPIGNPYTDPITGRPYQDMVRVTPDPTPDAPFRVRLDPYKQPLDENVPDPIEDPQPDPNEPLEPIDETFPLFCDWAEVVCDFVEWFREDADEPEGVDMPELELEQATMQAFGLPSTGSCPPPRTMALGFGSFVIEYTPFCDFASAIRPLILAGAYLFSGFLLLGVRR